MTNDNAQAPQWGGVGLRRDRISLHHKIRAVLPTMRYV